jgi:hypothetical protein
VCFVIVVSLTMPKPLSKHSQEMIAKLIRYFEQERDNRGPLLPLGAVRERVANALQVSVATISGVSSKIASNVLLRTPKKKRPRTKLICDLDENYEMEIRNVIYDMVKNSKYLLNIVMQIIIANFIFRRNLLQS